MSGTKTTSLKQTRAQNNVAEVTFGEGKDDLGRRYFKFFVRGSQINIPPMSAEKIANEPKLLFSALTNAGWSAFTQKIRSELLQKLQQSKRTTPSFKVVTRLGWNSGAYVCPREIIGEPKESLERAFDDLDPHMLAKYRSRGTLEEWNSNIAVLCSGNSRLMFSACLAFTGPILRFVTGPKAGGFQIYGSPETGKTTAAMVAGSIWGCHRGEGRHEKGFVESWNSTAAKVEVTALAHNDALLILDETKQAGKDDRARAQVVKAAAFGLAEMTEKERLTNPGLGRSWRCYFLSTSNFSLCELGKRGSVTIDEAERGRMADIPLPKSEHGLYEKLNGFANGDALSDQLQRRCRKYYGTAARKFIEKVVQANKTGPRNLRKFVDDEREAYRKALKAAVKAENLKKPLGRSSGRYATVFAAGSLARSLEIVPWDRKQILNAVLSCQSDQLRRDQEDGEQVVSSTVNLRNKLVRYLSEHRADFMNLEKERPHFGVDKLDAVPGYRDKVHGKRWFYLTAYDLTAIIGSDDNARALKRTLVTQGLLAQKVKDKFVVQRKIFAGGKGNQNYAWACALRTNLIANQKRSDEPAKADPE